MVVSKEIYHKWMLQTNLLNKNESEHFQNLIKEYPYFQTNQILLAKSLSNTNSIDFNKQLKIAAAYSASRYKLFYIISEERKKQTNKKPKTRVSNHKEQLKKQLGVGEALQFGHDEQHSFSQWLQLSQMKPITREEKTLNDKINLIEEFIHKERKPVVKKFFSAANQAKTSTQDDMTFVTETLARVYLEQEHYHKAKTAYEKLSLKYPEKSSFFAGQIKLINKIITKQ